MILLNAMKFKAPQENLKKIKFDYLSSKIKIVSDTETSFHLIRQSLEKLEERNDPYANLFVEQLRLLRSFYKFGDILPVYSGTHYCAYLPSYTEDDEKENCISQFFKGREIQEIIDNIQLQYKEGHKLLLYDDGPKNIPSHVGWIGGKAFCYC